MPNTPPSIARTHKAMREQMQSGTILSFTKVHHLPEGFTGGARIIGLIELDDKSHVLAEIHSSSELSIGQRVLPRLRLNRVTPEKLREYAVCFEPSTEKYNRVNFPGYILALSGPSGVGKTTISALLSSKISVYAEKVPIMTTRAAKPNDDDQEYRHISLEEFKTLEKQGEMVAVTKIPSTTEDRWYGYRAKDIETIWNTGKIPIVVTEMGLLQDLAKHFGRRSILSFGLLPPGKSKRTMLSHLLHRLRTRGRDSEESIRDRMQNAEKDLAFFEERRELFDHLLINEDIPTVIHTLTRHVLVHVEP